MKGNRVARTILHGVPPVIFAVSGLMKLASRSAPDQFEDWGYPRWWAWVTGGTELVTAGLLADRRSSHLGLAAGAAVLAGGFGTHLREREIGMLAIPVGTGALMLASWAAWHAPKAPRAARRGFPEQLDAERRALEGTSNREP